MRPTWSDIVRWNRQLYRPRSQGSATPATFFTAATSTTTPRSLWQRVPKVPIDTLDQAGGSWTFNLTDDFSGRSAHKQPHFLCGLRKVIGKCCTFCRILRREKVMSHIRDVLPIQHQRGTRHCEKVR